MKPHNFFILLFTIFLASPALALEAYSVVTNKCDLHQGLIVDANPDNITMLTLEGRAQTVQRSDIDFFIIYNTVENPIKSIKVDKKLRSLGRRIFVENTDEELFVGWAVRFIEDLVIFYDSKGQTHVLEMYSINKVRPEAQKLKKRIKLKYKPVNFDIGGASSQCPKLNRKKSSGQSIRATRILGDKIQISEFLSNLEIGFKKLVSYQERTYLYAKPFLYEEPSKLGILVYDDTIEQAKPALPMYFQWSSGEAYRFQSFNQIGATPVEYLPTAEPLWVIRSDLKSHIFHGSFVGNIPALSAGTEFFTSESNRLKFDPAKDPNDQVRTSPALNYMAMMGADYGPWSFSIGTYYPVYMMQVGNDFREVLASNISPLFRVMFTTERMQIRALFSRTDIEENSNVTDSQISIGEDVSVVGQLNRFDFTNTFIRAGIDYRLTDDFKVGFDQIFVEAAYNETTAALANNNVDFTHLTSSLWGQHQFGDKVTLKLFLNFHNITQDSTFTGTTYSETENEFKTGGTFEFVF